MTTAYTRSFHREAIVGHVDGLKICRRYIGYKQLRAWETGTNSGLNTQPPKTKSEHLDYTNESAPAEKHDMKKMWSNLISIHFAISKVERVSASIQSSAKPALPYSSDEYRVKPNVEVESPRAELHS
ncbi:hypothetical protein CIHG_08357 [Coccidioides immitis H538.4]|uniref:Uncharacterized protein n=2 Tax=Coccidioides immitis TaxID=5501 RepID=A0A0J8US10_COCIT|nr:hypothetical protein CIRG_06411 [Coccidioides immitis RMSCC 2394]KMU90468.1 hypothetical protein CIHG_08357 [Coccidioides immitis H538.4]